MGLKFNANKYNAADREVRIKSRAVGKRGSTSSSTCKHRIQRKRKTSKVKLTSKNREFLRQLARVNR